MQNPICMADLAVDVENWTNPSTTQLLSMSSKTSNPMVSPVPIHTPIDRHIKLIRKILHKVLIIAALFQCMSSECSSCYICICTKNPQSSDAMVVRPQYHIPTLCSTVLVFRQVHDSTSRLSISHLRTCFNINYGF